ncbi:MAG: hypothetical protein DSY50_05870, partial [Desulfobulbus sp.]
MSSKRIDFSFRTLIYHVIPYWICTLLFFFTTTAVIYFYLRQQEQVKVQQQLHSFQAVYNRQGPSALQLSFLSTSTVSGSFLRLESPTLRLVLISNNRPDPTVPLPDFSSFSVADNLLWHSLQSGTHWGGWSVAATQLQDGTTLQVGIRESDITEVPSFLSTSSSGCFIATAAYGTSFAEEIDVLRNWRDDFLEASYPGRLFIRTYYSLSPPVADNI